MRLSKKYAGILAAVSVVSVLTVSGAVAYHNHTKDLAKNNHADIITDSIVSSEARSYANDLNTTAESLGSTTDDSFTQPENPENSETNAPNVGIPAQTVPASEQTQATVQAPASQSQVAAQTPTVAQTRAATQTQSEQPQVAAQTQAAASSQSGGNVTSSSQQNNKELVLQDTNQIRQAAGAGNLTLDSQLSAAADIRAQEIVQSFSHTRPDGTPFYSIAKSMGIAYSTIGENIAYGYSSAASVVEGWKNSPGHYRNMVNTQFNKLGVGVYVQNGTYYWVQLFTN